MKKEKDSVLLHCCCAPCSIYPIEILSKEFKITNLWFNPNIYDEDEYEKRKQSFEKYNNKQKSETILVGKETTALQKNGKRIVINDVEWKPGNCEECYKIRIKETVKQAKKAKISNFSLTLLGSPYQNKEKLRELAKEFSHKSGVKFIDKDFSKGFYLGKNKAKEEGLYLQKYCGCIKSKQDYLERKLKKNEKRNNITA